MLDYALSGADPGMDITATAKMVNAIGVLARADANKLLGWALNALHDAYDFDVTGIGSARGIRNKALDSARLELEGMTPALQVASDPLPPFMVDALKASVMHAVVAYNGAAQAAADTRAHTSQLYADLVENVKSFTHDLGAAVGNIATNITGGLLGGFLGTPFGLLAGAAIGFGLYRYVTKGRVL